MLPYAGPFVLFLALLSVQKYLTGIGIWQYPLWIVLLTGSLWVWSRPVLSWRLVSPMASIGVGIAVFAIWIAPDYLFPGYRQSWLFQNSLFGTLQSSIPAEIREHPFVLFFRSLRAIVFVPILEELFWRGFLMRWLIHPRFTSIPLGAYDPKSFWVVAALFASEHGPYWDVGLLAGVAYNWWMIRTKSLADCILAHAVTNGVLCAFVIATQRWEYWQ